MKLFEWVEVSNVQTIKTTTVLHKYRFFPAFFDTVSLPYNYHFESSEKFIINLKKKRTLNHALKAN